MQYRADLVQVTSDTDAAIESRVGARHTLAAVAAEKDAAIMARDSAAAERDAIIAAAIAESEAVDAQDKATYRVLLNMPSAKDSAVTEKDSLAPRHMCMARALATVMSTWTVAKEKNQAVARCDKAQRAKSDVVAKVAALAAREEALAAKSEADAEREVAAAAKEVSQAALVAMTAERDVTIIEKDVAVAERESVGKKVVESSVPQLDAAQKTAQKKLMELTKANDSLTSDNAKAQGPPSVYAFLYSIVSLSGFRHWHPCDGILPFLRYSWASVLSIKLEVLF